MPAGDTGVVVNLPVVSAVALQQALRTIVIEIGDSADVITGLAVSGRCVTSETFLGAQLAR